MPCSQARIEANRTNALRSTGPKTVEGKEAARQNALKHGLTGQGIVVPGEDAGEIDRRMGQFAAELAGDGSVTTLLLAQRVAVLSVRLDRSVRQEFAATAERVRCAGIEFDEERRAEARRRFAAGRADLAALEPLRDLPEGVDLLLDTLSDLRRAAEAQAPGGWDADQGELLGRCLGGRAATRGDVLARAVATGDFAAIDSVLVARLDPAARVRWALGEIVGLIDAEVRQLEAHRRTLDYTAIVAGRAAAVERALVADDPTTLRHRKYEAATERSILRALKEIRAFQQHATTPQPAADPTSLTRSLFATQAELARLAASSPPTDPALGSFFPEPPPGLAPTQGAACAASQPGHSGQSRHENRRKRRRPHA